MFRVHNVGHWPNVRHWGWVARGSQRPAGSSEF